MPASLLSIPRSIPVLGALLLFNAGLNVCYAQEREEAETREPLIDPMAQNPPLHFLERNYVFHALPSGDLGVEAQISPHITIFQNLTLPTITDWSSRPSTDLPFAYRGGPAWAVTISPLVRARILTTYSAPVRIPSYLPHLTVQHFRLPQNTGIWPVGEAIPLSSYLLAVGHHSNGQDGCILVGLERPDGECRDPEPEDIGTLEANTQNGSFSTNYIRLGAYRKRLYLDDYGFASSSTWAGVVFETHPEWLKIGGVMEGPLRSVYGTNRIRLEGGREQLIEVFGSGVVGRFEGALGHIFKSDEGSSPWMVDIEASLTHYRTGSGLFARYYFGQDYYNIHFTEDLSRLELGLMFDQGKFQQLRNVPRSVAPIGPER